MKRSLALLTLGVLCLTGCATPLGPEPSSLLATATPSSTAVPTATATPTPTPSPTPTPTPQPAEILVQAEHAYTLGDWETAETLYGQLLPLSSISQEQAINTSLGLGETLLAGGDVSRSLPLLADVIAAWPDSPQATEAHLHLADALMESGAPEPAIDHYQAVLNAEPILAPYAYEWLGDAWSATGTYTAALTAYTDALSVTVPLNRRVYLLEKIALIYTAQNAYTETLATYDAILDVASVPYYRARIVYQAALAAQLFGDQAEACRRMETLITTYPEEAPAYEALVQLVEADIPVDDMLRGKIDYHAGAYGPAVQAFYRLIQADPEHTGEPHYYAGLAYLEAGSPDLARYEFDTLIEIHQGDPFWGSAWLGQAAALVDLGQVDEALAAYRALPEAQPDHPRAAEALWDAAELLERENRLSAAADAFLALAERYPDDSGAPEARFRAGLDRSRAGEIPDAIAAWEELLRWYPGGARAQSATFWLGKTYLESGNVLSGTAYLNRTVTLAPWDYYGLRATALLEDRPPLQTLPPEATLLPCTGAAEQQAVIDWLASWLPLEPLPDLSLPPEALLNDPRLERGVLLLALGHFDEGRAELEALRTAFGDDAWAQYHLALIFREAGLYRSSILAAAAVWRLSPADTITEVPRFLGCLVYPTYFDDLVQAEAAEFGFDPLVVYALLRQESLFEGFATSYAAAHGLMQVIPSTGAQIAEALAWPPGYETADLYRPMVSVRFGTWYLAQQRDRFAGELYPSLAGYNGGPGNAARWWQAAGGDRDLFVELIGFRETRTYVERITEHYARYLWLYTHE